MNCNPISAYVQESFLICYYSYICVLRPMHCQDSREYIGTCMRKYVVFVKN